MDLTNLLMKELKDSHDGTIESLYKCLFDLGVENVHPMFEDFIISEDTKSMSSEDKEIATNIINNLDLATECRDIYKEYSDDELLELGLSEEEFVSDVMSD